MDLFGGWGGFLGYRDSAVADTVRVKELRRCRQRFPDTHGVDYGRFLTTGGWTAKGPLLERGADNGQPIKATVALIGGGIANLIAAYELSRCGVVVTMFEQQTPNADSAQKPFGGRLATDVKDGYVAELGAAAFPSTSPLIWHYVWRWAISTGMSPDQADELVVRRFPSPGVVPTACCYLNEWFEPTSDLSRLPIVVRNAAYRFRSWLDGLSDGEPDPRTTSLMDAMTWARDPRGTESLDLFWTAMIRRYGGRSFGCVLRDEVFGGRPDAEAMYNAFAAVGVGTGGFDHLDDISVLEFLRHVLWDFSSLYMLPDLLGADGTGEPLGEEAGQRFGSKMQDFAEGLANAALASSQQFYPSRTSEDMFRFAAPVQSLCVIGEGEKTRIGVCLANKDPFPVDFTIVGVSSRAMQVLGLGQDSPTRNPFRTWGPHDANSLMAVQSIQAAVHRLNMMSSYKAFARIAKPESLPAWPINLSGKRIECVVMDRYPRTTTVMPSGGRAGTMLVAADTWTRDALKFQGAGDSREGRRGRLIMAFQGPDRNPLWRFKPIMDQLIATEDFRDRDWNRTVGFGGGIRLNRPEDEYFASSLLCQSRLVQEKDSEKAPWGRAFLAGDSVGYHGGWAEGAAMSALHATTAVLYQVRKSLNGGVLEAQSLLEPEATPFHTWTQISADATAPQPTVKSLTNVRRAEQSAQLMPPRWRWDLVKDVGAVSDLAVSHDGEWMAGALSTGYVYRAFNKRDRVWDGWEPITAKGPLSRVAVSAKPADTLMRGEAQMLAVRPSDGALLHAMSIDDFERWNQVSVGQGVGSAAIAVQSIGDPRAHIAAISSLDNRILHSIRSSGGGWQDFRVVHSKDGTDFRASDVAVVVSPGTEALVLVCVGLDGVVTVIGREPSGPWTSWLRSPNGSLKAERVSVTGTPDLIGRVQIVAKFSDGNLYYQLFHVWGTTAEFPWRPLPYPATPVYNTTSFAIGASTNPCDFEGSATVWLSSTQKAGTRDLEVEGP